MSLSLTTNHGPESTNRTSVVPSFCTKRSTDSTAHQRHQRRQPRRIRGKANVCTPKSRTEFLPPPPVPRKPPRSVCLRHATALPSDGEYTFKRDAFAHRVTVRYSMFVYRETLAALETRAPRSRRRRVTLSCHGGEQDGYVARSSSNIHCHVNSRIRSVRIDTLLAGTGSH